MAEERGRASRNLTERVAAQRRMVGERVGRTSSVPLAVFAPCDPMVEAKLLDDAISLLRHMSVHAKPEISSVPPPDLPENRVTAEDIAALLKSSGEIARQEAPDLHENGAQEWLWMMADIAMLGPPSAQARATEHLATALSELCESTHVDEQVLTELARMLQDACGRDDRPDVFEALHDAAARALDSRSDGAPPDGDS